MTAPAQTTTSVEVYVNQIPSIEERVKSLAIVDEESKKLAIETGVIAARLQKNIDDLRTSLTDPLNTELKLINGQFQPHIKLLEGFKTTLRGKINEYDRIQERRRQEEQARIDKLLAEKRQKELDEAKAKGVSAPAVALTVKKEEAPTTVQSDTGSATRRKIWKAEITDMVAFLQAIATQQIPTDAIEIQVGFLNRMAGQFKKDGVYPGVRFFEDFASSFNTKG